MKEVNVEYHWGNMLKNLGMLLVMIKFQLTEINEINAIYMAVLYITKFAFLYKLGTLS